jgi:hypothetical protein
MTSCVHKMCGRTYGLFIFGILVGHDLSMRILYRFHGWLIFARVIALFIDVWSNKHEKGYNSCKNQPSVKSVKYAHAQIMANHDTKYE